MLHTPEYIGAEPVARATWLNLLLWCAAQENGGRIVGAETWPDRRWQQTAGVTMEEVRNASPLIVVEGDEIVVWGYPVAMEQKAKNRSDANRRNGLLGGRPSSSKPTWKPTVVTSVSSSEPVREDKGRKDKGRGALARWTPPTLNEWLAYAATLTWPTADAQAAYDHYLACGWRIGSKPVRNWQAAARNCHRRGKTTTTNGSHRHSLNGSNSRAFVQSGAGHRAFA